MATPSPRRQAVRSDQRARRRKSSGHRAALVRAFLCAALRQVRECRPRGTHPPSVRSSARNQQLCVRPRQCRLAALVSASRSVSRPQLAARRLPADAMTSATHPTNSVRAPTRHLNTVTRGSPQQAPVSSRWVRLRASSGASAPHFPRQPVRPPLHVRRGAQPPQCARQDPWHTDNNCARAPIPKPILTTTHPNSNKCRTQHHYYRRSRHRRPHPRGSPAPQPPPRRACPSVSLPTRRSAAVCCSDAYARAAGIRGPPLLVTLCSGPAAVAAAAAALPRHAPQSRLVLALHALHLRMRCAAPRGVRATTL